MPDRGEEVARRMDAFAAAHKLQDTLRRRWASLAPADRESLLDLAEALRLGENHLRDVFDWAEEIALRDSTTIAAVLSAETVRAARARDLGRNEAIKAVREALRRLRFPRLVEAEERLGRQLRSLRLPPNVRLILPLNLQDTEVRVEIRAGDTSTLSAAVESLRAAMQRPEFAELFRLLSEAP